MKKLVFLFLIASLIIMSGCQLEESRGAAFSEESSPGVKADPDVTNLYGYYWYKKDHGYTITYQGPTYLVVYSFDGILCKVYDNNTNGADVIPIYRYYSSVAQDNIYAWQLKPAGQGTYKYKGVSFYAYKDYRSGTIPIYRHYNSQYYDHLLSTSETPPKGYVYEVIAFYAYPK